MKPPLQRQKNSFILKVSPKLYHPSAIRKAREESSFPIREIKNKKKNKLELELKTTSLKEVLDWVNNLFYLNRSQRSES